MYLCVCSGSLMLMLMLMLMEYVVIGINVEHAITSRGLIMIRDYNSNFMHVLRSRYVAFEQLL